MFGKLLLAGSVFLPKLLNHLKISTLVIPERWDASVTNWSTLSSNWEILHYSTFLFELVHDSLVTRTSLLQADHKIIPRENSLPLSTCILLEGSLLSIKIVIAFNWDTSSFSQHNSHAKSKCSLQNLMYSQVDVAIKTQAEKFKFQFFGLSKVISTCSQSQSIRRVRANSGIKFYATPKGNLQASDKLDWRGFGEAFER